MNPYNLNPKFKIGDEIVYYFAHDDKVSIRIITDIINAEYMFEEKFGLDIKYIDRNYVYVVDMKEEFPERFV